MTTKRPDSLRGTFSGPDRLADGAFVLHVSTQLNWVYVQVLTSDGYFRTRRYRHNQQVKVMDE